MTASRLEQIDSRKAEIRTELLALEATEASRATDLTTRTPEEQAASTTDATRSAELIAEWDALEAERPAAEKMEAIRAAVIDPKNRENGFGAGVNVQVKQDPFENLDALRYVDPNSDDVIARAITGISEVRSRFTRDEDRQAAVRAIEQIPGAAVHALVHGSEAYRSAFQRWGGAQGQNPLYTPEEAEAVRTALSLTGANGGYTLPTLFDPTLIKTGTAVKSPIREISRVESITQNVWHGVSVGNVTAYWTAEAADFTDGSPVVSNPSVTAQKLTAYVPGSYEIFEDSNLLMQLPGLIAEGMSYVEQTAFVSGNGTTQPLGVITAISATAASTVTATTRGSFTTASSVDIFALLNSVAPRYEDSVKWVGNKASWNVVRQMSPSGAGSLFWGDLSVGRPANLLGADVINVSAMSAATTSGTVLLILGDFSQYLIVDRIGTTVEFVQNVYNGTTNLPTGQRALVAHKRVGGAPTDINAFRFLKT
jgi:HK97 family phage major capsid protein